MIRIAIAAALLAGITPAAAQTAPGEAKASPEIVKVLAPTGVLRAAINYGNSVLAQKGPVGPQGVSAELSRHLARQLGVPVKFITFDAAGKVFEAGRAGAWDVAFLAIEPARAAEIDFSPPYVLIEGTYLVPKASPLKTPEEVDAKGVRIGLERNSAYDLYLTRTLKNASLVRADGGPTTTDDLRAQGLDAIAGVRQNLAAYAKTHADVRIMDGRFQEIRQAVTTPKDRPGAAAYVRAFIEEAKRDGFVKRALLASGQADADVAPAAKPGE